MTRIDNRFLWMPVTLRNPLIHGNYGIICINRFLRMMTTRRVIERVNRKGHSTTRATPKVIVNAINAGGTASLKKSLMLERK